MKRVFGTVMATALSASLLLSGCGSKEASESVSADGVTGIRFASWDNAEDLDKQQALVDKFNESQDKIKVTLEAYGGEYDTKISAGMGSGDAPDVMYMWNYPAYYGGLEPLEPYMEKEGSEFKENYYETLWSYNQMEGSTYGIPIGFTTQCLYYNKDLFDQAGVSYPTSDWTWDDLKTAAKTITEKCEGVKGFSYQMKADPYDYEMYLWSNGSGYVDKEGNLAGNLNSDKSVEAFKMFQDMQKDGYAIATEKSGTDEMSGGKIAMYVYGAWSVNRFTEEGLNFGVVEVPAFAGASQDSVSILSSSGLSISKDSKNKEAAWEFVKYWTGEELNKARIGYELPALKSVVESEKIMEVETTAPFYKMLEQSTGFTPACFLTENWSEISADLALSFERIFNPSALEDPKTVLDEAVQ